MKRPTNRRAGAVLVLLTPAERQRVRAAAARAGLAVSAWVRTVALAATVAPATGDLPGARR